LIAQRARNLNFPVGLGVPAAGPGRASRQAHREIIDFQSQLFLSYIASLANLQSCRLKRYHQTQQVRTYHVNSYACAAANIILSQAKCNPTTSRPTSSNPATQRRRSRCATSQRHCTFPQLLNPNNPSIQPCCVCKDEKAARDECMLFSTASDPQEACKDMVTRYRSCMASYGFNLA
jgi:hypothetical protein